MFSFNSYKNIQDGVTKTSIVPKEVFCHRTKLYTVSTFITLFMLQNRLILTSLQLI